MTGRRVDTNHAEIREALRERGYAVEDTSQYGHGFPDLQVDAGGIIVQLEVKMPGEELNARELRYHAKFCRCPVYVVHGIQEAIDRVREVEA